MRIPGIELRDREIFPEELTELVRKKAAYLSKQTEKAVLLLRAEATVEILSWILAAIYSARIVAPVHPSATSLEMERYRNILGPHLEIPSELPEIDEEYILPSPMMDKIWAVLFSSGSSGIPKAVALSGKNFQANARAHGQFHQLNETDRWLLSLPLFHVGGFATLTRALFLHQNLGFTAVTSPEESLYWLGAKKVSGLSMVPTMLWRLLELDPSPQCAVKVILLGGAGIGGPLLVKATQAKLPLRVSYGLTESCSQLSAGAPNAQDASYAGKLLPGFTVKIGATGEIGVRGAAMAQAYWQQGELIPILDSEGFFPTQDLGHISAEGELSIFGRKSDLIISGGENIFPQEVEDGILQLPMIIDAAVVGLPDPEWGQIVAAAVVLRDNLAQGEAEIMIRQHLRTRINPWKIPKRFLFLKEIPRNRMKKILRQEVLQQFLS